MAEVQDKNIQFYNRARKEYYNNRPINYDFSLTKQDPKSRKFRILLGKMVDTFKQGMLQSFKYDAEEQNNYWQELELHFSEIIEMKYIMNRIYEGKQVKIRLLFMLILNNKKLFRFLEQAVEKMPNIYKDPENKRKNLTQEIQPVDFFKDGQFTISASNPNYIADFRAFQEEEVTRILLMIKEVKIVVEQMVDRVVKEDKERLIAEEERREKEKIQKEEILKQQEKRKAIEDMMKMKMKNKNLEDAQKKIEEKKFTPSTPAEQYHWDKKPRGMKNSQYLYLKKFKDELQIFDNNGHPFNYTFKANEKNQNCAECGKLLSKGFYFFGSDMNLCNDTGKWFCNEHMASERIQVPHKAKNQFDLRGYQVSRRSYESIKLYYEMPLIELRHTDKVVYENKVLYDFMVLKRQLHLMYDSICNIELMEKTFPKRVNYFLKKSLFSLKNLYDTYNGHETAQIQKDFAILQRHFYKCDDCQRLKGRLCHICDTPPKIFAFELRDTYACKHCHFIYHRRCLKNNVCPCQRQ